LFGLAWSGIEPGADLTGLLVGAPAKARATLCRQK
jgi:hypothetical protein